MGVRAAFVQGWHRVWRARILLASILLATVVLARFGPLPFGAALGPASRTTGLGLAAVLAPLPGLDEAPVASLAALAAHLAASLVLLGALLAGLAADRALGFRACLLAGATRVFRVLRLGLVAGASCWVALALHNTLPGGAGTALAVALLFPVSLIVGYAEVRLVVEDRRTALGALVAGARFVRSHAGTAVGLHLLNALLYAAVLVAAAWLLPDMTSWWGTAAGPLLLFTSVAVQVQWTASQLALFQDRLGGHDTVQ